MKLLEKQEISIFYSISLHFHLINFIWVLKGQSIKLIPEIILLNEIFQTRVIKENLVLKKKYFFFTYSNKTKKTNIFTSEHTFNWDGFQQAIHNTELFYHKVCKGITTLKSVLYIAIPLFFPSLSRTLIKYPLDKLINDANESQNLLFIPNFDFFPIKSSIIIFLNSLLFDFTENEINSLTKKIFNSEKLFIDYRYNIISFEIIPSIKELNALINISELGLADLL